MNDMYLEQINLLNRFEKEDGVVGVGETEGHTGR